jgi:hypothetical protein
MAEAKACLPGTAPSSGAVRSGGVERLLYVWFGRADPTRRQLSRANAELRSVG